MGERYLLRENLVGLYWYCKPSIVGIILIKTWKTKSRNSNHIILSLKGIKLYRLQTAFYT